jgi:hypothetical protein
MIDIKEIEVSKINLQPGDTLVVKLKGEEWLSNIEGVQAIKKGFDKLFPENPVAVLTMPANHDVEFSAINELENSENKACNTQNYCADCNCGKKESQEGAE